MNEWMNEWMIKETYMSVVYPKIRVMNEWTKWMSLHMLLPITDHDAAARLRFPWFFLSWTILPKKKCYGWPWALSHNCLNDSYYAELRGTPSERQCASEPSCMTSVPYFWDLPFACLLWQFVPAAVLFPPAKLSLQRFCTRRRNKSRIPSICSCPMLWRELPW